MIYKEVIFMEQDMMEALIMQKEKCKEKKRETFFHYAEKQIRIDKENFISQEKEISQYSVYKQKV